MELWIRSQDKKEIIKANEISIDSEIIDCKETGKCFVCVNDYGFGTYKSEKRALEVLDEIQQLTTEYYQSIDYKIVPIYEMPKE